MRTGTEDSGHDELLFQAPASPTVVSPPPTALTHAHSSVVGMMPMQPMPASVMSPDDMLRAYAERRAVASPPPSNSPALPPPAAARYDGNGMRVLYSPTTPDSAAPMLGGGERKSAAPTEASKYDDEDAYVGTAA